MDLAQIALVAGGLGLLLFGMKMMSTGLEAAAGDSLQTILRRATSNRLLGVLAGIIATICINSSTAVTIITVGFVNSRLINLTQAIGIIMGANVGTTFSAQIMAFKISTIVPFFIFVGVIMYLFFKQRAVKNVGYVILGFGILLFSIDLMGAPLKAFSKDPMFETMLATIENPLAALIAGFIFTAVIQSSSATMGILVSMHLAGVPIPFETSAFIILGTNIGTSTTTVIASIPASRESKRAALFHINYDIIGSTVFGTLIFVTGRLAAGDTSPILQWFQTTWDEPARQVAMFHTLYNIATLCVLFPFVKWLALLMEKIVPLKQGEVIKTYEKKLLYLDDKIMKTPMAAVMSAHNEICRMGEIANETLSLALEAFYSANPDKAKRVFENEKVINYLDREISQKLIEINHMRLSKQDAAKVGGMFGLLIDIERIGDHAENIAEYTIIMKDNNIKFSDIATEEVKKLSDLTTELITKSLEAYKELDESELSEIKALEDEIDALSVEYAGNHIKRLKEDTCNPKGGTIFIDMITDLERSSDHAYNIATSSKTKES